MLERVIELEDFNGVKYTETLNFNLTKSELTEMELTTAGGYKAAVEKIVNAKSVPEVILSFKELLLKAYGVKSPDGKRFIKNDEVRADFLNSPAYDVIFMELMSDDEAAAKFINGIVPKDIADEMAKAKIEPNDSIATIEDKINKK